MDSVVKNRLKSRLRLRMEVWLSKIEGPAKVRVDEFIVEPVSLVIVFFFFPPSLLKPRSRNRVKER